MNYVTGVKDGTMAAARPLESGKPLSTWGVQRRCTAPGCDTLLSRYNPADTCTSHGGWRNRR